MDNALVDRCRDGDLGAFQELVERYQRKVYITAYGVLNNREDAMDVSQDVFVRVHNRLDSYEPRASFASWIRRITVNLAIDHLRKRRRRHEVGLFDSEGASIDTTTKDRIEKKELLEGFQDAIQRIDKKHSEVLILREIEGLDYESIANQLQCSIGTVMSRLHYARKKVFKHMQHLMGENVYESR